MSETLAHTVRTRETLDGRYIQALEAGAHRLQADEPQALGGNDTGPNPYELLLMALGACTNMTLRMYAEMKQLPLRQVETRLSVSKIHAEDCSDCDTRQGSLTEIRREIILEGELEPAQRQRLLEIANRCPVHRLLTSEVKIRSSLADR